MGMSAAGRLVSRPGVELLGPVGPARRGRSGAGRPFLRTEPHDACPGEPAFVDDRVRAAACRPRINGVALPSVELVAPRARSLPPTASSPPRTEGPRSARCSGRYAAAPPRTPPFSTRCFRRTSQFWRVAQREVRRNASRTVPGTRRARRSTRSSHVQARVTGQVACGCSRDAATHAVAPKSAAGPAAVLLLFGRIPMTTLWSGRFDAAPDAEVFDYGESLSSRPPADRGRRDRQQAWAEALAGAGVSRSDDARAILDGLAAIRAAVRANPASRRGDDEDVHSFVERLLVERMGDTGKRLHTGRSRNEQVSLDFRLYLRRRIPALQRAIAAVDRARSRVRRDARGRRRDAVVHALLAGAARAGRACAARRTPPRFAATSSGFDVARARGGRAHARLRRDCRDELQHRRRGDPGPRPRLLARVVANSIDASGDRDFVATFLYACAMTMVHLSRLAED